MKVSDLLKLEKIKAINMRMPIILSAYLILSFFSVYAMSIIQIDVHKIFPDFDTLFIEISLMGATLFFGIIIIINIGIDYNKKIFAKQFISGISKKDFIIGKILYTFLISIIIIIIEIVKYFILKYMLLGEMSISLIMLYKMTASFLMLLNIVGLYAFLTITIGRKIILSSVIFYLIIKAESLIIMLEKMKYGNIFSDYLPIQVVKNSILNFIMTPWHFLILFVYLLLSVLLIIFLLNKNEIILNKG